MDRRLLLTAGLALLAPGWALAQATDDKHGRPEGQGGARPGPKPAGPPGGGPRPGGGPGGPGPAMRPSPGGRPQGAGGLPAETRPAMGTRPSFDNRQSPQGTRPSFDNRQSPQGSRPSWGNRPAFGGRPPGVGRPQGFRPIQGRPFRYPQGYGYRRWGIGAALPLLFLSSAYYFNDYGAYGLYPPPYGYRWVRYGPDLLLVQIGTGYVADAIYGAFY